jgi:enoyl-CoA hydratase
MNALNMALLAELADEVDALHDDDSVRALILAGGERAFAAGADVSEFSDSQRAREVSAGFSRVGDSLRSWPHPVIAAVSGYALGGGLEVALCADLRIAADNARVGQPEVLLGLLPGGGGTQRLARLIGPARTKDLVWTGRQIRADEALAWGIFDRVVPADTLEDAALSLASELAASAAVAIGISKRVIDDGLELTLDEGVSLEADGFAAVFRSQDAAIGVASFLENGPGKATFTGK